MPMPLPWARLARLCRCCADVIPAIPAAPPMPAAPGPAGPVGPVGPAIMGLLCTEKRVAWEAPPGDSPSEGYPALRA